MILYSIFILCLWLRIIGTSDQGVWFMNFPSQIFFNDINHGYRAAILKKNPLCLLPFFMAVTTYLYYENVHRTIRTAIVSYLLKMKERNFWQNWIKQKRNQLLVDIFISDTKLKRKIRKILKIKEVSSNTRKFEDFTDIVINELWVTS